MLLRNDHYHDPVARRMFDGCQVAPGAHAALVFDGAGYRLAKDLAIPENITLVSLLPFLKRGF